VFPHLITAANVPKLVKTGDVDWDGVDAAFCCLPHATTQVQPRRAVCYVLHPACHVVLTLSDVDRLARAFTAQFKTMDDTVAHADLLRVQGITTGKLSLQIRHSLCAAAVLPKHKCSPPQPLGRCASRWPSSV